MDPAARAQANSDVVREAWEAIQRSDWETMEQRFAEDYRRETGSGFLSRDDLRAAMTSIRQAFATETFKFDVVVADEASVAFRWELTARHVGEYLGVPATQRVVRLWGLTISRVADGRIVEELASWNRDGLLEALDVLPLDDR